MADTFQEHYDALVANAGSFVRTSGGRTVHKADCPIAARSTSAVAWTWADQFLGDAHHLFANLVPYKHWNRPCSRCLPEIAEHWPKKMPWET